MTTNTTTSTRTLGRSGIEVSALGLGGWAIGGPWTFKGNPGGWSQVDDAESVRAIHRALDLGVTFFDTAATYGAGHSEEVLGRALANRRDEVVIATKFGYAVDEATASAMAYDQDEENGDVASHMRDEVVASLRRLGTDYIDVYQLHPGRLSIERALEAREVLEQLVAEGLIRTYGWSTDRPDAVAAFATSRYCNVVQQNINVVDATSGELLDLARERGLASIVRSPLAMGLLTGKYSAATRFASDDQRHVVTWHPGFSDGQPTPDWLARLATVRDALTANGHSLAQGALAWLWARSPNTIPIPGFKSVAQAEENAGALALGPLPGDQFDAVEAALGRGTLVDTPS